MTLRCWTGEHTQTDRQANKRMNATKYIISLLHGQQILKIKLYLLVGPPLPTANKHS